MTWAPNLPLEKDLNRWLEVDGLLHQLDDAHQEDDSEKLLDVRARIITRMNQLQAFCEQYKHDENSKVFEEELSRLKRALESYGLYSDSPPDEAFGEPSSPRPMRTIRVEWDDGQRDDGVPMQTMQVSWDDDCQDAVQVGLDAGPVKVEVEEAQGGMMRRSWAQDDGEVGQSSPLSPPRPPRAPLGSPVSPAAASFSRSPMRTQQQRRKPGRPRPLSSVGKALYDWELPPEERPEPEEEAEVARGISTDYGAFRQGPHRGYYYPAESSDGGEKANPLMLDFQVVLTESEYRTLMARRRGSRKYQSSQPGARESLLTSTPFVDRWRIDHAMYRPASKEQWLSPDGFKTAC